MTLHIDDSMDQFLQEHLRALRDEIVRPDTRTATTFCYHCHRTTHYPLIARAEDIRAFEELLCLAEQYLDGFGVRQKMLAALAVDIQASLQASATVREIIKAAKK